MGTRKASTGAPGTVRRQLRNADAHGLISELEPLCRPSTALGYWDVACDYGACTIVLALGLLIGSPLAWFPITLYVGIRQRYLSNLVHECVHDKLVASRRGNALIGRGISWSLATSYEAYRSGHSHHHAELGRGMDPKLASYRSKGATLPGRDRPRFVRQVICRPLLGEVQYSAMKDVWGPQGERCTDRVGRGALWALLILGALEANVLPVLISWAAALILVRPAVNWLTDVSNHAGLIENEDPLLQTRGWTSHWLARHALGGHLDDLYHPVHHCFPRVTWRALPVARDLILLHFPEFEKTVWCSGYFFRRRSTPDTPSVIEDIVSRLARPSPGPASSKVIGEHGEYTRATGR
jgi:fatty acid desaturase